MNKYLSEDQVYALNQRHGWFQYGDAQSDVSNAFANDAIEMYERIRNAAPLLLEAAQLCRPWMYEHASNTDDNAFEKLCAAIAKATGEKP